MGNENYSIIQYPSPILRKISEPIIEINDEIKSIAKQMLSIIERENGLGLACPQIGLSLQMFVVYVPSEMDAPQVFINPKLVYSFQKTKDGFEGCLSIPNVTKKITRSKYIIVTAKNLEGVVFTKKYKGLTARCIQHEYDHLKGILIIDR